MNNHLLKAETLIECSLAHLERAALKEDDHLKIIDLNQVILQVNEALQTLGELDD